MEPKKWRCDVATVKEAEEGAGEEEELHIDHGIEPVGNASDDDDDDEEEDAGEEEEADDGERSSEEGSWGVTPPEPGKYST